ncbi:MAG: hypothetical protein K6T33_08265 [Thermomonas hydrothermalis]|uniref:TRCF domain-containing protein n=1 Tax=Thermomonas hydrothermalis TaxID=213588 RepID=UPI002357EB09|nr:TRCF domain-containing protein [Thermomonas hydrothermalis]MCL6619769.1 hypothetical protein [Thermomonas hydrothermalis]
MHRGGGHDPALDQGLGAFLALDQHDLGGVLDPIQDRTDLENVADEMEDRFGPLPELVRVFLEVMELRRVLRDHLVTSAYRRGEKVTLHFHPDSPVKGERLVTVLQKERGRWQLSPDLRLTFTLKPGEEVIPAIHGVLRSLGESC